MGIMVPMPRAALACAVVLAPLAACGPESTTIIDAPTAADARRDGPTDAPDLDTPDFDAPIDAVDALEVDALDAPPPCTVPIQTFTMDGVLDPGATVIAGGASTIRIAVAFSGDGRLYVATDDAGRGSDHFLLLSATPPGPTTRRAPFAKAGQVAVGTGPMLFLADENDNDFEGWFRLEASGGDTQLTGAAYAAATAANGGVVEGTVDLVAAFGAVPPAVSLAAVLYATADGGALVPAAQTPQGDGDVDVDAAELVVHTIPCILATE